MKLCPGSLRAWFVCWPHQYGLVPVESSGHNHRAGSWHLYVRQRAWCLRGGYTQEQAEADGWVCVQLWLSVQKPAHYSQGGLSNKEEGGQ